MKFLSVQSLFLVACCYGTPLNWLTNIAIKSLWGWHFCMPKLFIACIRILTKLRMPVKFQVHLGSYTIVLGCNILTPSNKLQPMCSYNDAVSETL